MECFWWQKINKGLGLSCLPDLKLLDFFKIVMHVKG